MNVYHYTSFGDWRQVKTGSWMSGDIPGLANSRRVCKNLHSEEGATDGAVFGLLEPEPKAWTENTDFPLAWQYLVRHVGGLLVSYEPTDEIVEKSHIIDWSHMERFHGGHKDDLGKPEDPNDSRIEAERSYWGSRVPLSDYIDNPNVVDSFALPEVISQCIIPYDLIQIEKVQPMVPSTSPFQNDSIRLGITANPELEFLSSLIPESV